METIFHVLRLKATGQIEWKKWGVAILLSTADLILPKIDFHPLLPLPDILSL